MNTVDQEMEPSLRATITGGPQGLEIVILARRHLVPLLFLGVWLVGWLTGELAAGSQVFTRRPAGPENFLLIWLILWTAGGLLASYIWLWMLVGKERILLGTSTLQVKQDVLGLGRTQSYELFKIRNLRVAPQLGEPRGARVALRFTGLVGGLIAFEYQDKTIRFGAAIDEAEGRMIVERMKQRYAFSETSVTA